MKAVALRGSVVAFLRRVLLRSALLNHNGESVLTYGSRKWYLAPFPEAKGIPYSADNLATVSTSSFRQERRFQDALDASLTRWESSGMDRDISWRLHVAIFASQLALGSAKPGDKLIELGSGRGFMAAGIINYCHKDVLENKKVHFYLMDTFRPDWQGENAELAQTNLPLYYADGPSEVIDYFSGHDNVEVVEGELPGTLRHTGEGQVIFLHVDLNSAEAERQCLEELGERLGPRSVVLFDDSTNPGCEKQLQVHRNFAHRMGTTLLELPTGQALMVCP